MMHRPKTFSKSIGIGKLPDSLSETNAGIDVNANKYNSESDSGSASWSTPQIFETKEMWSPPPHHVLLQLASVQLKCETLRMTTRTRPCSPQDEWRDLKWEFLTGLARPSHTLRTQSRDARIWYFVGMQKLPAYHSHVGHFHSRCLFSSTMVSLLAPEKDLGRKHLDS
jgi:hypothetical protein